LSAENDQPVVGLQQQLQELSAQRGIAEEELAACKQHTEQLAQQIQQAEKQRHETEQTVTALRHTLEQIRLAAQTLEVRAKTLEEQIAESGYELTALLNELPETAQETELEAQLVQVVRKIERLGAINLAAIEEYQVLLERKNYLDAQHVDLTDALAILQDAIQKMDRETQMRFKETFDQINSNFQALFPRLFGGGHAALEMVDNNWLTAGIALMAQPPGKRNSTIHLLSGGEKALTAIALVFSLFQLNPAPFCMLDEVDAPLDDANVVRFCNLVREMSAQIQFIFISHNKLAIEMAQHLAGVTMHEAGVSRLVAVDVEEAIALAVV
jgi:chromosome segregation protein